MRYLREGKATWEPKVEYSPTTPKACTLSWKASGRGRVSRPSLTKAALLRQESADKKVDKQDKHRNINKYGPDNNFDFFMPRTPNLNRMLSRSQSLNREESSRNGRRCRSKTTSEDRRLTRSMSDRRRPIILSPPMSRRQSPSIVIPCRPSYSRQISTPEDSRLTRSMSGEDDWRSNTVIPLMPRR